MRTERVLENRGALLGNLIPGANEHRHARGNDPVYLTDLVQQFRIETEGSRVADTVRLEGVPEAAQIARYSPDFSVIGVTSLKSNSVSVIDPSFRQQTAIMGRIDSRPTLAAIKCPTLVLTGDEDNTIPNSLSKEMADGIPGAKLTILSDCGHMPQPERPQATGEALIEWLRN